LTAIEDPIRRLRVRGPRPALRPGLGRLGRAVDQGASVATEADGYRALLSGGPPGYRSGWSRWADGVGDRPGRRLGPARSRRTPPPGPGLGGPGALEVPGPRARDGGAHPVDPARRGGQARWWGGPSASAEPAGTSAWGGRTAGPGPGGTGVVVAQVHHRPTTGPRSGMREARASKPPGRHGACAHVQPARSAAGAGTARCGLPPGPLLLTTERRAQGRWTGPRIEAALRDAGAPGRSGRRQLVAAGPAGPAGRDNAGGRGAGHLGRPVGRPPARAWELAASGRDLSRGWVRQVPLVVPSGPRQVETGYGREGRGVW